MEDFVKYYYCLNIIAIINSANACNIFVNVTLNITLSARSYTCKP